MKTVYFTSEFQYADDGDTTHYGGSFRIAVSLQALVENHCNQYYYCGNDRQGPAADCVFEALNNDFNAYLPLLVDGMTTELYDHFFCLIDSDIYEFRDGKQIYAIAIGDDNVITSIEPMKTRFI
jgi:hypothetical protein